MKHFVRATFVAGALVTSAACGGSGGTSNEPSLRADSLAPAAEAEPAESSSTIATPVDLGNGGSLDLNAPHDDVALCAAIDSGSFAAAVGGVQVFSIPGPDAEELATIRPGSGAFPLLGQCRVTIDDATYVSLQVVDMVTLEEAADDYLARLDILEDSSLEGREGLGSIAARPSLISVEI